MSGSYGAADRTEAIAVIHRALDLGIDLLDTSDIYGAGDNERLVGRALKGRRDDAVLATKFGITGDEDAGPHRAARRSRSPDLLAGPAAAVARCRRR